jgi:hypothetical protein
MKTWHKVVKEADMSGLRFVKATDHNLVVFKDYEDLADDLAALTPPEYKSLARVRPAVRFLKTGTPRKTGGTRSRTVVDETGTEITPNTHNVAFTADEILDDEDRPVTRISIPDQPPADLSYFNPFLNQIATLFAADPARAQKFAFGMTLITRCR